MYAKVKTGMGEGNMEVMGSDAQRATMRILREYGLIGVFAGNGNVYVFDADSGMHYVGVCHYGPEGLSPIEGCVFH